MYLFICKKGKKVLQSCDDKAEAYCDIYEYSIYDRVKQSCVEVCSQGDRSGAMVSVVISKLCYHAPYYYQQRYQLSRYHRKKTPKVNSLHEQIISLHI